MKTSCFKTSDINRTGAGIQLKTKLTSSIRLAACLAALWGAGAHAGPLDPAAFTSLGANPFTLAGSYSIDTSGATPVLTRPDSSTINGIVYEGIAVFTFDDIAIAADTTIGGLQNAGSRPFALLSHDFFTMTGGMIDVSGANGESGNGGNGGNAGPGGGGGGGGGTGIGPTAYGGSGGLGFVNGDPGVDYLIAGNGGSVVAGGGGTGGRTVDGGGGAFGGNGGDGSGGFGGTAYGDLSLTLQGGSGGAGGFHSDGAGGGGGGGGVEIGALGNVILGGTVLANGGTGGPGSGDSAGGGAGGGILVHAPTVSISGNLNAIGGMGSFWGGAGGGGRVLVLTDDGTLASGSLAANVNVSGGGSHLGRAQGQPGVAEVSRFNTAPLVTCLANVTHDCAPATGVSLALQAIVSDADESQTLTVRLKQGDDLLDTQTVATPADNTQVTFATLLFLPGDHPLTIEVDDGVETGAACNTTVTINADTELPSITCPPSQIVNATSPSGATVTFAATTMDNCGTATLGFSKNPGTMFSIGDTAVTVTATDGAGNQSSCGFNVHVNGAAEQINALIAKVNALPNVKSPNKTALVSQLQAALTALAANNKPGACYSMQAFINLVKAQKDKKLISAAAAVDLTADATRIKAVLGCS